MVESFDAEDAAYSDLNAAIWNYCGSHLFDLKLPGWDSVTVNHVA